MHSVFGPVTRHGLWGGELRSTRMIAVHSGSLWFGIAESFDKSKLTPCTAGIFFTEPLTRCDFR
jgi:hypothetical protein